MQRIIIWAAAADGAGVGWFVEACVETVVNEGELVDLIDVPVQLSQPFIVLLIEGKALIRTCDVFKSVEEDLAHVDEVGLEYPGGIGVAFIR